MPDDGGNHGRAHVTGCRDEFGSVSRPLLELSESRCGFYKSASESHAPGHNRLRADRGVQQVMRKPNHRKTVGQQARWVAATGESARDFPRGSARFYNIAVAPLDLIGLHVSEH